MSEDRPTLDYESKTDKDQHRKQVFVQAAIAVLLFLFVLFLTLLKANG